MERLKKEQEEKEKAEAHLYTIITVARDEDLAEQIGRDIYFDLVDHDKVRSFRVQKQMSFNLFKEEVAKEFGVPVQFQRYWLWAKRQNQTYRPIQPLTHIEEAQSVGQLRELPNKVHNAKLNLFLEVELGRHLWPLAPPDKANDDILIFFKLYNPEKEMLRYVGRLFVKSAGKPSEILTRLNEMVGYDPDEEIALYEEIKFEPNVMCEPIDKELTFLASQLGDGDIICFQKAPAMDSERHVLYPDVPSYLEYVHNRQAVHFRSLDKPEVDDFILVMSMLDTYDDVVKRVAQQLGLVDPSKIRLTPHNCSSEHPKPQLLKYLAVEHLSDMLVHYNQASDILYYEVLDIPLPDMNGSSTGHLERHTDHCLQKLHMSIEKKQPAILSQPSNSANPFVSPGVRYSHENMREIIATAIMVHEQPFSIVEDEVWMWAFQYANSEFQKVTCETVRGDCLAIYEAEKKKLKALLKSVSKISLTIDVWKSSDQVDEYMVIFGHFIDAEWKLQKRILSFVKILAPRQIIDVVGSIFKCLKVWGIENKVFLAVVDNAPYNDSCLSNIIGNLPFGRNLFLGGDLLHIRCFVQILNLLVQDGLSKINDIIYNVRESVRYISYSDLRLKAFYDVVEQKHLKDRKLIIDCPTRCDSTFHMLSIALKFKIAFLAYMEIEPHYDFAPTHEDWEKVEKVCQLLKEFYLASHIISDDEYPTASLYLVEVCRVKQVIDYAAEDKDLFMREMVSPMKVKFDKYLGECNMLIALASVLDPRCKFHIVDICFPLIYKPEEVAKDNIKNVRTSLQELYQVYVSLNIEESSSGEVNIGVNNTPSSSGPQPSVITGFDQIMSLLREKKVVPTMKSELDVYLEEGIYVPNDDNIPFSALEWWRNNSLKFKILSKLAADILAIPFSIVPSESTFSARGRVINEFHSKLNEESIEAFICGGDWLRHKYGLKRKLKVPEQQEEITLNI